MLDGIGRAVSCMSITSPITAGAEKDRKAV